MAQIDNSIYFKKDTTDLTGAVQKGLSMRDMIDGKKRKDEEYQQQKDVDDAFKSAMVQGPDGGYTFDKQKALTGVAAKGHVKQYLQMKDQFQQQDIAAQKAQFDKNMQEIEMTGQILGTVTDQHSWVQALKDAQRMGIDTSKLPQGYDPSFVNSLKYRTMKAKDQLDQQMKDKQFSADQDWKSKDYDLNKQKVEIDRSKAATDKAKGAGEVASKLRQERSGLPTTKATQEISTAYNKIQAAAKTPSAAGDLSLIFGYMKLLDPGSTVREGEFANAQNAAGIPDRIMNAYNNALKGERLNPDQRKDFIGQAGGLYKSHMAVQNQIDSQYRNLAKQAGVNPDDVILNFEAQVPVSAEELNSLSDDDLLKLYEQSGGK